jgi:hypothetical protein
MIEKQTLHDVYFAEIVACRWFIRSLLWISQFSAKFFVDYDWNVGGRLLNLVVSAIQYYANSFLNVYLYARSYKNYHFIKMRIKKMSNMSHIMHFVFD